MEKRACAGWSFDRGIEDLFKDKGGNGMVGQCIASESSWVTSPLWHRESWFLHSVPNGSGLANTFVGGSKSGANTKPREKLDDY